MLAHPAIEVIANTLKLWDRDDPKVVRDRANLIAIRLIETGYLSGTVSHSIATKGEG